MDHRRRMTCCWVLALCILWPAAADRPLSFPITKVFLGTAGSPASTTEDHSTAGVTGSRTFDNASRVPAYSATESASLPVPPATPSSRSTLRPPSSRSSSRSPTPAGVEPTEERIGGGPSGEPTTEPQAAPAPLCDYDSCVHLQGPCPELRHLKGWNCRCPGQSVSGPHRETPGPVVALEVTRTWPTSASLRWCAPDSLQLSAFLVWVLRPDGSTVSNGSMSSRSRRADVFGLSAGGHAYLVCVSAQGTAGALSHSRCVPVATPRDAEAIATYVLAGACGALLLAALVLGLCLCRQCERRRGKGGASRHEHACLDPPAHAFHDACLTCSMVSIANPAYAPANAPATASAHCAHRAPAQKTTNVR